MNTYDNILGIEGENTKPRAQQKREGLPVSQTPHDHTQEQQQTSDSAVPPAGDAPATPAEQNVGTSNEDGKAGGGVTPPTPPAQAEGEKENGFYKQFFEKMQEDQKAREAQHAKDEKTLKRQRLFAAIGDGISALANVYFASKGAPNMNNGEATMSKSVAERGEQLKRERLALDKEHSGMLLKLGELQDKREKDIAERKYRSERLRQYQQQQDRLDRETKLKEAKGEAYSNYYQALSNKNEEQAAYWKAKAEAIEAGKPLDIALKEAKIASEKAKAAKYNHDANKPYTSGKGSGGSSSSDGTVNVTEEIDARGRKTVTRSYKEPAGGGRGRTNSGGRSGGGKYPNTKKLGL